MAGQITLSCEELRRLYQDEGQGVARIAAGLGCSPSTVSNRLRRCGIPTRSGRFQRAEVPRELLQQLYAAEALPLREVAARLGVSVGTINNRLRAYAIPRRRRSRAAGEALSFGGAGRAQSR